MEDERTIDLEGERKAVIRTRVTMKDKLKAGQRAAKMMDMTLGDDNKPVVRIDMSQRYELDEQLLKLFVVSVDGKSADHDALDVADGEALLDAIWEANGARLGLDRTTGLKAPERAAAIPKAPAKS